MPVNYPSAIKQQPIDKNADEIAYPFPKLAGLPKPNPKKATKTPTPQPLSTSSTPTAGKATQSISKSPLHGITRLSVVSGEGDKAVVSQPFNNGKGNSTKKGRYLTEVDMAKCFCFAPSIESPKIAWKIRNTNQIKQAKFELFCKDREEPIWSQEWKSSQLGENLLKGSFDTPDPDKEKSVRWSGSLDWDTAVKIDPKLQIKPADSQPAFPDGLLTVEHSPYQLRMTINDGDVGTDKMGYPLVAWTYIHVLIHDIQLSWGTEKAIHNRRIDLKEQLAASEERITSELKEHPNRVQKSKEVLASEKQARLDEQLARTKDLVQREKILLEQLSQADIAKDLAVSLPAGVYDYNKYSDPSAEFAYYQTMWGKGPRLPLFASVRIKNSQKQPTKADKALGHLTFLWDWQDNLSETVESRLDSWLGEADASPEDRGTSITRRFLKETFEHFSEPKFPQHAFNAPEVLGGKRGAGRPDSADAPVFPAQSDPNVFPFKVDACQNRTWAAISHTTRREVLNHKKEPVQTGVLFQPAAIAGDQYRITVYVNSGVGHRLDVDLQQDTFFDLNAQAVEVPHAATGLLTILRSIKGTYYASDSFIETIDLTTKAISSRLERELGYQSKLQKANFPNLQSDGLQELIADIIQERSDLPTESKSLWLHASLMPDTEQFEAIEASYINMRAVESKEALDPAEQQMLARLRDIIETASSEDNDYAFHTWAKIEDYFDFMKVFFLSRPVQFLKLNKSIRGRQITGRQSNAKAVVMYWPVAKKLGYELAFHSNEHRFQSGESVDILLERRKAVDEREKSSTVEELMPAPVVNLLLEIEKAQDASLSSLEVHLQPSDNAEGILTYSKNERTLSEENKRKIDELLSKLRETKSAGKLTIIQKADTKQNQARAENIAAYANQQLVYTENFLSHFLKNTLALSGKKEDYIKGLETVVKDIINPSWRYGLNNALLRRAELPLQNLESTPEGEAIFYQVRGRTRLDKKFTTGGIENNFCTEKRGIANLLIPTVTAEEKVEKRWLKSSEVVGVHEFGHLLLLKHAMPRFFDSKLAPSVNKYHLAHDACIMNYDADTASFCGICILRKRGWNLSGNFIQQVLGDADNQEWAQECLEIMRAEVKFLSTDPVPAVRLAMFLLSANKFLQEERDRTNEAIALMKAAEAQVPEGDDKYVWMLRNQIVFYTRLTDDATPAKQTQYKRKIGRYQKKLTTASQFDLDTDVTRETTAKTLGIWKNTVR